MTLPPCPPAPFSVPPLVRAVDQPAPVQLAEGAVGIEQRADEQGLSGGRQGGPVGLPLREPQQLGHGVVRDHDRAHQGGLLGEGLLAKVSELEERVGPRILLKLALEVLVLLQGFFVGLGLLFHAVVESSHGGQRGSVVSNHVLLHLLHADSCHGIRAKDIIVHLFDQLADDRIHVVLQPRLIHFGKLPPDRHIHVQQSLLFICIHFLDHLLQIIG
mmetsp:Transcript_37754/g.65527  ORF Transcript_37754/g.65527 Transcript_37754/m.65527 type:complete len:216 (-) Transcript_37754:470-1117(-)